MLTAISPNSSKSTGIAQLLMNLVAPGLKQVNLIHYYHNSYLDLIFPYIHKTNVIHTEYILVSEDRHPALYFVIPLQNTSEILTIKYILTFKQVKRIHLPLAHDKLFIDSARDLW